MYLLKSRLYGLSLLFLLAGCGQHRGSAFHWGEAPDDADGSDHSLTVPEDLEIVREGLERMARKKKQRPLRHAAQKKKNLGRCKGAENLDGSGWLSVPGLEEPAPRKRAEVQKKKKRKKALAKAQPSADLEEHLTKRSPLHLRRSVANSSGGNGWLSVSSVAGERITELRGKIACINTEINNVSSNSIKRIRENVHGVTPRVCVVTSPADSVALSKEESMKERFFDTLINQPEQPKAREAFLGLAALKSHLLAFVAGLTQDLNELEAAGAQTVDDEAYNAVFQEIQLLLEDEPMIETIYKNTPFLKIIKEISELTTAVAAHLEVHERLLQGEQ